MDDPRPLAVVTGTTSGIGLALLRALLDRGWQVAGLARRPAPLEDDAYTHLAVDLADPAALRRVMDEALAPLLASPTLPRVGLVNNAAMLGSLAWLRAADAGALARMFAVNAAAPMALMALAADRVPPSVPLRVVNVSSGAARDPLPGLADYAATKAALRMAGRALAGEFAAEGRTPRQAAVFSYEPGVVDTAMQDAARDASPDAFPSHDVFRGFREGGHLNPPDDVVGAVAAFLDGDPDEGFTERRYGEDG